MTRTWCTQKVHSITRRTVPFTHHMHKRLNRSRISIAHVAERIKCKTKQMNMPKNGENIYNWPDTQRTDTFFFSLITILIILFSEFHSSIIVHWVASEFMVTASIQIYTFWITIDKCDTRQRYRSHCCFFFFSLCLFYMESFDQYAKFAEWWLNNVYRIVLDFSATVCYHL